MAKPDKNATSFQPTFYLSIHPSIYSIIYPTQQKTRSSETEEEGASFLYQWRRGWSCSVCKFWGKSRKERRERRRLWERAPVWAIWCPVPWDRLERTQAGRTAVITRTEVFSSRLGRSGARLDRRGREVDHLQ